MSVWRCLVSSTFSKSATPSLAMRRKNFFSFSTACLRSVIRPPAPDINYDVAGTTSPGRHGRCSTFLLTVRFVPLIRVAGQALVVDCQAAVGFGLRNLGGAARIAELV